jgi:hypothetical protein
MQVHGEWEDYAHDHDMEEMLALLRVRTQNVNSDGYFRCLLSFFVAQVASSMRVTVTTADRGVIPVNVYGCLLAESGAGKGHSLNILEQEIFKGFKERFTNETFKDRAEVALAEEALENSTKRNTQYEEELEKLEREFKGLGAMPYSFSESSSPAYKQVRSIAQIAQAGSTNFIMDELGSNMVKNADLLDTLLETYDVGLVKDKLTKSGSDNVRYEQRSGAVPSNVLMFGTPTKVLDGGRTETDFLTYVETGYGRRCIYALGSTVTPEEITAEEMYDKLTSAFAAVNLTHLVDKFTRLADMAFLDTTILVERDQGILLMSYKMACEKLAATLPEQSTMLRAELQHRYFKALKIAGALSFKNGEAIMTTDSLYAAIKIVEESGDAFQSIVNAPKAYIRLAHFIAQTEEELTQADLVEALPYYKGNVGTKSEMLSLAMSYGYKNNIVIKKYLDGAIEFIKGETLKVNELDNMILSYSGHEAYHYKNVQVKWENIGNLVKKEDLHWVNHHLRTGHRSATTVIQGFNMVVLDCDGGVSLRGAKELLKGYKALFYVTKRHTKEKNRFRIILPMKYKLNLDTPNYKAFMKNLFNWLPFDTDSETGQPSRKWLTNKGGFAYIDGELLDPLPFIPDTSKSEEFNKSMGELKNMDNVRKFFAVKMATDGRNNTLLKYAMMLKDSGLPLNDVVQNVADFNDQLKEPLEVTELEATIFVSLANAYAERKSA